MIDANEMRDRFDENEAKSPAQRDGPAYPKYLATAPVSTRTAEA